MQLKKPDFDRDNNKAKNNGFTGSYLNGSSFSCNAHNHDVILDEFLDQSNTDAGTGTSHHRDFTTPTIHFSRRMQPNAGDCLQLLFFKAQFSSWMSFNCDSVIGLMGPFITEHPTGCVWALQRGQTWKFWAALNKECILIVINNAILSSSFVQVAQYFFRHSHLCHNLDVFAHGRDVIMSIFSFCCETC